MRTDTRHDETTTSPRRRPFARLAGLATTGGLLLAAAGLAAAGPASADTGTSVDSFDNPGSYSWQVPAGVHSATFRLLGGNGGAGDGEGVSPLGGRGAILQATLTVTPGDTYTVTVGGRGADAVAGGAGGFNGGGDGAPGWANSSGTGHGGGGGDGGAGLPEDIHGDQPGGTGGGVTGATNGQRDPGGGGFGWAGTATGGGAAGLLAGHDGTSGTAGTGGTGGAGGPGAGGGGGGGGLYGGGGGAGTASLLVPGSGGGGGSGYATASATAVSLAYPAIGGSGSAAISYAVPQPSAPTISGTPPSGTTGQPYDFAYAFTGFPDPTFTADGLPPGLDVSSSGHLAGTPTGSGDWLVTVTATNADGSASVVTPIRILEAPTLPAGALPDGNVDVDYSPWRFQPGGFLPPTCSVTAGSVPAGLQIDPVACSLSGRPTAEGTFPFTLTADNGTTPASRDYTVTVHPAPAVSAAPAEATAGVWYASRLAGDSTTCALDPGSSLPQGLGLDPTSCIVSGLPTTEGSYPVVVQETTAGTTTSRSITLAVGAGDPLPTLAIGDQRLQEGNGGTRPMTFTVTLSAPSTAPVAVHWWTRNGTARAGSDYVGASGKLTFRPGQTTRTITVLVTGDRKRERDETFGVVLSAPTAATISDSYGLGVIVDDD